jgi:hypothetical protein
MNHFQFYKGLASVKQLSWAWLWFTKLSIDIALQQVITIHIRIVFPQLGKKELES